jgi:hypothetical protein
MATNNQLAYLTEQALRLANYEQLAQEIIRTSVR